MTTREKERMQRTIQQLQIKMTQLEAVVSKMSKKILQMQAETKKLKEINIQRRRDEIEHLKLIKRMNCAVTAHKLLLDDHEKRITKLEGSKDAKG